MCRCWPGRRAIANRSGWKVDGAGRNRHVDRRQMGQWDADGTKGTQFIVYDIACLKGRPSETMNCVPCLARMTVSGFIAGLGIGGPRIESICCGLKPITVVW